MVPVLIRWPLQVAQQNRSGAAAKTKGVVNNMRSLVVTRARPAHSAVCSTNQEPTLPLLVAAGPSWQRGLLQETLLAAVLTSHNLLNGDETS
jgi:hypothetical protein